MTFWTPPTRLPNPLIVHPYCDECGVLSAGGSGTPVSGTFTGAPLIALWPLYLREPFTVAKSWVLNGATVGTDSWDLGVYQMTDQTTG